MADFIGNRFENHEQRQHMLEAAIMKQRLDRIASYLHDPNADNAYHNKHVEYMHLYMDLIARKSNLIYDLSLVSWITAAHDLVKRIHVDPTKKEGYEHLPTTYEEFEDIYGSRKSPYTDPNPHAPDRHGYIAAQFIYFELGISDPRILYPVAYHSGFDPDLYEELDHDTQMLVDHALLADKLSSNHLKLMDGKAVPIDLDLAVFGPDGREFNYTLGLILARLIGQGKNYSITDYRCTVMYQNRLRKMNPCIDPERIVLEDKRVWPARRSAALKIL